MRVLADLDSFVERNLGVVLEALLAFAPEAPDQHEDEERDEHEQVDGVAGGVHVAILKAVRRAQTAFATLSRLTGAAGDVCAILYVADAVCREKRMNSCYTFRIFRFHSDAVGCKR